MEVASGYDLHISLFKSILDINILILIGYLSFVALQLYFLTRHAIADDLVNIGKKSILVKRRICMAFLSLLATWYYMFRYLFWSYDAYLQRAQLTGAILPTVPQCSGGLPCQERRLIARLERLSSWLSDLSLFEEAWLHVVRGKLNWWWSVEICMYTVGFWALYVRSQGRARLVTYSWAYMILGQTVAIGVAANLFNAAIATRESRPTRDINGASKDVKATSTTRHSITLLSPPRYGDIIFTLVVALAGLAVVDKVPSDIISILVMHMGPMLMVLPVILPSTVVHRSLRAYISLSSVYAVIAIVSFYIRLRSHFNVWSELSQLPQIFVSHPAQSSISSDTICITITAMVELYENYKKESLGIAEAIVFILLTPIVGPSVTMAASYALIEKRAEDVLEKAIWDAAGKDESMQGKDIIETSTTTSTKYSVSSPSKGTAEPKRGRKAKVAK